MLLLLLLFALLHGAKGKLGKKSRGSTFDTGYI
jgi:hypothetical protein